MKYYLSLVGLIVLVFAETKPVYLAAVDPLSSVEKDVTSSIASWYLADCTYAPNACRFPSSHDTIESAFEEIVSSMLDSSISHGLDSTVLPCDNHFLFVNGGWRKAVQLPASSDRRHQMITPFSYASLRMRNQVDSLIESSRKLFPVTTDQTLRVIGTFYESCMVADTLETNYHLLSNPKANARDSTKAEQCTRRTLEYMGAAVGQAFAEKLKESGSMIRMEYLMSTIKKSVREQLQSNPIMSVSEKEYALNRFDRLVLRVGIPDELVDYAHLTLSPNDYEYNKNQIANFRNSQWVSGIGSNVREKWKMSLLMANAVYIPGDHAIEIPTLMFSPPFFFPEGEDLMNFAGVGYIIGHEIFHGVASQLRLIEGEEMKAEIDSFKAFHTSLGELDGWKANGNRTFNEDVADLGGSKVAYRAWKEVIRNDPLYKDTVIDGYTAEQRFWIALGKTWRSKWTRRGVVNGVHGPHFARVNGMVMQSPEFKEAFGCQEGDAMVLPSHKLSRIW